MGERKYLVKKYKEHENYQERLNSAMQNGKKWVLLDFQVARDYETKLNNQQQLAIPSLPSLVLKLGCSEFKTRS